jgi:hypothetical protein
MRVKILGWNPINDRSSTLKASVYIKPTFKMLEFFNRAPYYRGIVKISDTNSCYDDINIFAIIDKSSDVPNKRDNFFESNGLYVITLDTIWRGYPSKNGVLEFQEGIIDDIITYLMKPCDKDKTPIPSSSPSSSPPSSSSSPSSSPSLPSPSETPELDKLASSPAEEKQIVENFEDKVLGMNKQTLVLIGGSFIVIFLISLFLKK